MLVFVGKKPKMLGGLIIKLKTIKPSNTVISGTRKSTPRGLQPLSNLIIAD